MAVTQSKGTRSIKVTKAPRDRLVTLNAVSELKINMTLNKACQLLSPV